MNTVRGPQLGPSFEQIHDALVQGFDGYKLSDGKSFLSASNTITASVSGGRFPFLAFTTGSFSMSPWKDFEQSISWDIPAKLMVQGPGEDGEKTIRRVLMDVIFRTQELIGLPIDENGNTVPFNDDTIRLYDAGKIDFLCERGAPFIRTVRVTPVDDGLATADIVFHVEATMKLDPRTLRLMKVGVLGINPVPPDGLFQDTTAEDGRGIALVFGTSAESAQGGYASQDPSLPPGFINSNQERGKTNDLPSLPLSQLTTSINVTPYSLSLSVGTPTAPLAAIAYAQNFSSQYVTQTAQWTSTNASVATVNASGVVSRVAPGSCTVFCTYNGVASNSVAVTCS
jgi:hypothetical protein